MSCPSPARWSPAACLTLALAATGCVADPGSLQPQGVEVVPNPNNVLSCFVRWTTGQPATSRVEFGEETPAFARGSDERVTEHEVLVIGMRPDRTYQLWPSATAEDGETATAAPVSFATGEPPFTAAEVDVTVHDPERSEPGWTLVNMHVSDILAPTVAAMIDAEGELVWYEYLGPDVNFGGVELSLVDGDAVLLGGTIPPLHHAVKVDLAGEVLWQGPRQPGEYLADGSMHHVMRQLPNGHYLTMFYDEVGATLVDVIQELTADNEVVWEWSAADHLDGSTFVHLHGNMAQVDLERDVAYFHAQQVHRWYQIDRASGELNWIFGATGDFELTETLGLEDPWFEYAHAPELLPGGTVLIYDNGDGVERGYSRVVEYAFDEEQRTAEVVWVYPPEPEQDEWYNLAWGDADRLANGNTLITSGSIVGQDSPSRLFEVTPAGEIVWEAWMSSEVEGELAGSYMSERIPALVEIL